MDIQRQDQIGEDSGRTPSHPERARSNALSGLISAKGRRKPVGLDAISGRNKLFGKITEMRYDGLLAQVSIEIGRSDDHFDHHERRRP